MVLSITFFFKNNLRKIIKRGYIFFLWSIILNQIHCYKYHTTYLYELCVEECSSLIYHVKRDYHVTLVMDMAFVCKNNS